MRRVEDLGSHKLVTADFEGQSAKIKIKLEQEVPSETVFLTIPARHCCVYEDEHLILIGPAL